jgi:uncharacterized protein (DUF1697 family)
LTGGKRPGAHVALLRGVNVGGANKLPMKGLAALFAAAGCSEVQTYIQSGNVVFRAADALARRIPALISAAIAESFRLEVPVVTRTAAELREVAEQNPFLRAGADPAALHVAFLAERPGAARVALLDPARSPPDQFAVRGREIYLHCPNGVGRSKLTNQYFDSRLATISTGRNWRTVLTLLALACGEAPPARSAATRVRPGRGRAP